MIRFTFNIDGKEKRAVMPEGWEECTLQQIIDLDKARKSEKEEDPLLLFAALSGQRLGELNNTPSNLWIQFFNHLEFLASNEPKWLKLKHPETVRINSKEITVPKDLGLEAFGQKVLGLEIMERYNKEDKEEDKLESLPEILALYFQPLYDGKFDRTRVNAVKKYVLKMRALDAVPIASFFLTRLLKSKNFGLLGLSPLMLIRNKKLLTLLRTRTGLTNLVHFN